MHSWLLTYYIIFMENKFAKQKQKEIYFAKNSLFIILLTPSVWTCFREFNFSFVINAKSCHIHQAIILEFFLFFLSFENVFNPVLCGLRVFQSKLMNWQKALDLNRSYVSMSMILQLARGQDCIEAFPNKSEEFHSIEWPLWKCLSKVTSWSAPSQVMGSKSEAGAEIG